MKFKSIKNSLAVTIIALGVFTLGSCTKVFDVEPKDAVDQAQMYRNVYDADAAVLGIYGKVLNLAKQYMLFNELRGDLMDVTRNADPYLKEISEHNETAGNPYINPQPFYEVILNCNDVLANFQKMLKESKFKQEEFNQRYSDIGTLRSWLYLQLGIHYGKIPYVTSPLAQVSDLHDATKFPMIELTPLIDSLVAFTEALPYRDDYPAGSTLQTVVDGYQTQKFFINKNLFLGDLYLWDGQYDKAADRYKTLMESGTGQGELYYNLYRVAFFSENDITYGRSNDATSLTYTPGWRYLFERGQDSYFNYEWIWVLPFDKNFAPQNPFIDLFSNVGGSYLVRPSQAAMDLWNSQTQNNNIPYDARGVFTYRFINGEPVIMKYLYNYLGSNNLPLNLLSKQGKWFLARAATLHLHYAEAANRAGKSKVAYAIVNNGIKNTYDPTPGAGRGRDVTNIQQTFLPWPYDFDAREGDMPPYRSTWYRNLGIRARANLPNVMLASADSVTEVENMIVREDALELAYEGDRWPDLLRVAIRRNDPSFLADKIYDKLIKSGISAAAAGQARTKLLNRDWFIPFKWD
ncbi:MAG: RagB/SusD family nutrient uptake outer membrane protein [Candidatus Dadabacteria bacterium]